MTEEELPRIGSSDPEPARYKSKNEALIGFIATAIIGFCLAIIAVAATVRAVSWLWP